MDFEPRDGAYTTNYEPYAYPSEEERLAIRNAQPLLASLFIPSSSQGKVFNNHLDYFNDYDFNAWLMRFNNKLGKLDFSYVLVKYYYNRGIPDEEWVTQLKDGSTQFFPNLTSVIDKTNLFLFRYASENFYYHYSSASDIIYHLLNSYFGFGIESKFKFNSKVKNKLSNQPLTEALTEFNKKTESFRLDRNDLAHNFPFYEIDIRSKRRTEEGKRSISLGTYKYTTSEEVVRNIDDALKPLSALLEVLKKEL